MLRVHLSFEESQEFNAFWEWGMGNGEWGMGNGEWGMGNGEWGMGNGEWERKSFCKIEMHRMLMFVKRDVKIKK